MTGAWTTTENPTNELYDFLYRDAERIASYYAQIWNGRLLSVEETSNETEQLEEAIKGNVQFASSESKVISSAQLQNKRTIDMHDAATVDLLIRLAAQRAESPLGMGNIQVFSGTCFFLHGKMLKLVDPSIDDLVQRQQGKLPKPNRSSLAKQKEFRTTSEFVKKVLNDLEVPSGFILTKSDNSLVCGPIKNSGLDQPISSFLFRAGRSGIRETYVIGAAENYNSSPAFINSDLFQMQGQMAEAFRSLLFPPDAMPIIPLAIYRKIAI